MDMIDEEIARLKVRMGELTNRIIPEFENKTQMLYSQILPLEKGSDAREKLEAEYRSLSNDLSKRSDELVNLRNQIQNLELEKSLRR